MTQQLTIQASAAIRAASGKPPRATILAYTGGKIFPPGFPLGVVIDLAGLKTVARPVFLLDHRDDQVVGQADETAITARTVELSGPITGDIENPDDPAHKVVQHARRGFQWPVSVGVRVDSLERVLPGESVVVNGQSFTGPVEICRAGLLQETSFLTIAADTDARATIAARAAKGGKSMATDFTEWLDEIGQDKVNLSEKARDVLLKQYEAEKLQAAGMPDTITQDWAAERERIAASMIHAKPGREAYIRAAAETARVENWSPQRLKLEFLRFGNAAEINTRIPNDAGGPFNRKIAAAAALQLLGREDLAEKSIGAREAQQARDSGCRTWLDLCERICATGHVNTRGMSRDELVRHSIRASGGGPSTFNLATALGDSAEKIALASFNETPATWRSFVTIVSPRNFKALNLIRVDWNAGFETVEPGGEIRHGTMGEETSTLTADTKGKLLIVDRRDIINDDLGVLANMAGALGRSGVRAVSDSVYSALLANGGGTFFAAAHNNFDNGADSVLSIDGLTAAVVLMRAQVDLNGYPADIQPFVLVVPPQLEQTARSLLNSTLLARDTSSEDRLPMGSPIAGMNLELQIEPRLSNAKFAGASQTGWYLFSKGGQNVPAVMAVGFVEGKQGPTIETVDMPFDRLGVGVRGYIDYGAALNEYRCGVFMAGA